MKPAKILLAMTLAAACFTGCSQLNLTPPDSKQEAHERWSQVRARMKLQLAQEHLRSGRMTEAEMQIKDAIGLDPKSTAAHLLSARLSLEKGELAAARSSLNTAIQLGGESAETDYLLGVLSEWAGDLEAAFASYRQASQRGTPSPIYIVAECETLVALDRVEEALDLIQKHRADFAGNRAICSLEGDIRTLRGQYAEAADAYREAALAAPDDPQAQVQYGAALVRSGRYEETIKLLAPLWETDKALPWAACQALGRAYLERGNAAAATIIFQVAAERYSTATGPWLWLARSAAAQGDWASARLNAEKVCRMDSRDENARLFLAYVCLRGGRNDQAREALESVLRESPDDWLAHYLMGRVFDNAGLPEAAAAHYLKARQATQAGAFQPAARELLAASASPSLP